MKNEASIILNSLRQVDQHYKYKDIENPHSQEQAEALKSLKTIEQMALRIFRKSEEMFEVCQQEMNGLLENQPELIQSLVNWYDINRGDLRRKRVKIYLQNDENV